MSKDEKKAATLRKTIGPLPFPKRGYGIHVYATSKNGDKIVYTAGRDVVVRDLEDTSNSVLFTEHKAQATVAKFSPNGLWIASGDAEGNVFVWELLTKAIKTRVQVCASVLDVDWDSEGKRIVAVGEGTQSRARCFAWDTGSQLGKIEVHNKPILSCSYRSSRPYRIITASEDLNVNIYEGPPFKFLKGAQEHARYPNCVRYSPDGEYFVSVGSDSKIVLWDGKSGDKVKVIDSKSDAHKGSIFSFSWSPDGKQILTASGDKTAKVWNIEDGACVATFNLGNEIADQQVSALWHKGDKKEYLITVSLSGAINFLNKDKPSEVYSVQGILAAPTDLKLSVSEGHFYVSNIDGFVTKFDFKEGNGKFFTGKGHGKNVHSVAVSGKSLITVGFDDKLRYNDIKGVTFGTDALALGGQPTALAVGKKDSSVIAVGLANSKLLYVKDGAIKSTLDLGYVPLSIDFSIDDKEIAVGGKDKKVHFYTVGAGSFTKGKEYKDSDKEVTHVRFRPDGSLLATIDKDRRLYFYNNEGKNLNPLGWEYHSATVSCGAWSPSGARFATGSADETILVWSDFKTFKDESRIHIKDAHSQGVEQIAFWDENTLISVGSDRSTRIWDLPSLS
jgi:WD40 repeat protein